MHRRHRYKTGQGNARRIDTIDYKCNQGGTGAGVWSSFS